MMCYHHVHVLLLSHGGDTMRTTLDIDEDILTYAKEMARHRKVSTGKVISDLVRSAHLANGEQKYRNGVPLFPVRPGGQVITLELVNQLRDEEW
jgi:hypothetical protein